MAILLTCFKGYSYYGCRLLKNSGKTTLITYLIRDLTRYGFKIAVFKHMYHSDFKVDYKGKDTWRYIEAGANASVAVSEGRLYTNEYLDDYPI
ncbi:MAG TPA: hypothetical protein ENF47_04815 [Thermoprotei archaeon]|nr:hypothetical protein [Thermoprotei archaeon]